MLNAQSHLVSLLEPLVGLLPGLSPDTCPNDEVVVQVTLKQGCAPPWRLLHKAGLQVVGDLAKQGAHTLYVAGARSAFPAWLNRAGDLKATEMAQVSSITSITLVPPQDKLRNLDLDPKGPPVPLIISMHTRGQERQIISAFQVYAKKLGLDLDETRGRSAGDLWFVPLVCPRDTLEALAQFTFLRSAQRIPPICLRAD